MTLVLSVAEYSGPGRWRWLLGNQETGQPMADHQVNVDPSADDYAAFTGLYRYMRWRAVPDRRVFSEAEIVARAGAWAGREFLGETIGAAILAAAPVTVQVMVPAEAAFLLGWPLELSHLGGRPLVARGDITFVYELEDFAARADDTADLGSVGAAVVRVLAVFSLPTATSVLALRRERYELSRLIRTAAARDRRQVELTVLQYGVTRDKLAEVAESGDGWDVLHLSGHGGAGLFLLECGDGTPDPVDTRDLIALLAPLRRRVKLAVVSACESAAAVTAETLRWIGLTGQADQIEQEEMQDDPAIDQDGTGTGTAHGLLAGIGRALATELGCAVVAMRYPVTDDFAIAFTSDLYARLLGARGQPLGTAFAKAIPDAVDTQPSAARPAICLATPVLIGTREVAGLKLQAPRGNPMLNPARQRMAWFPPEPERFVGRAAQMARASAALAAGSRRTAILLHGMAGSGKTASAVELAWRHQDSFAAAAFWKAPEHDDEFGGALASLAAALEIQFGSYGFTMADKITTVAALNTFLPRLRGLLEDTGILLVLDNLETLLTPAGTWRDPRWTPLISTLTGHQGESRVILTSRTLPAELDPLVLVLPVHALELAEAAALARELPGLRGLLHADHSPLRDTFEQDEVVAADRDLVRRVLRVVQGHPKLLELADATAHDRERLATQLAAAETAGGQVLDWFFRDGTTSLDATRLLDALTTWTAATLDALPAHARLVAQFLACLEDDDRVSPIVDANWADLWHRLGLPGEPATPEPLLAALSAAALIQPDDPDGEAEGQEAVFYQMHPGITQAIRATVTPALQAAADTELAAFWTVILLHAVQQEGGEAGPVIVRAGLAAVPYLLRQQEWDAAGSLLEHALLRDESPGTVQAALPALRAIADATGAADDLGVLARALARVDPAEAETLMRVSITRAVASQDYPTATAIAGDLANLLLLAGRLGEALEQVRQKAGYTRRAGFGPWSHLADQLQRVQILGHMGEHLQVLDQVRGLRARMDQLPTTDSDGAVNPWNVREAILDTGQESAQAVGDLHQAMDLNAAMLASMQARGAGTYEVAYFRFNNYGTLMQLGRLDEAGELLEYCQQVFEDHHDLAQLGQVLSARSDLEANRGNQAAALALQQTAIRYSYTSPEPRIIARRHHNLANRLRQAKADPAGQRAHRLAAALLLQLTGMAHELAKAIRALARDLRFDTSQQRLPATLQEVIAVAERTEGVRLGQLVIALQPYTGTAAHTLSQILHDAADVEFVPGNVQRRMQAWEPVVTLMTAAVGGDATAAARLSSILDHLAQTPDWASLVAVLRRIAAGDTNDDTLLDGLDPVDTAVAIQISTRLAVPNPTSDPSPS